MTCMHLCSGVRVIFWESFTKNGIWNMITHTYCTETTGERMFDHCILLQIHDIYIYIYIYIYDYGKMSHDKLSCMKCIEMCFINIYNVSLQPHISMVVAYWCHNMCSEIALLKLLPHFPGTNELNSEIKSHSFFRWVSMTSCIHHSMAWLYENNLANTVRTLDTYRCL